MTSRNISAPEPGNEATQMGLLDTTLTLVLVSVVLVFQVLNLTSVQFPKDNGLISATEFGFPFNGGCADDDVDNDDDRTIDGAGGVE